MNSLKNTLVMLMMAASMVGMGCGDDDDPAEGGTTAGEDAGGGNGTADAGDSGGDGDPDCIADGIYDGFKESDVIGGLIDGGACATEAQAKVICEVNPSTEAGNSGTKCATQGLMGDALATCTVEGEASIGAPGIRSVAPTLTDACLNCFAGSVACTGEKCLVQCLGKANEPECLECRETEGCTPGFFACAGLARDTEL